jgi:site-specific recombinase XerD
MPMKRTDFALCLNKYLTDYMVNVRGSTARTIESYRYAFVFLLEYYASELKIPADAITLNDFTYEHILGFYVWLEKERKAGISTRNQRQSAINSFSRYLMYERPEYLPEYQKILGIPIKKGPQKEISYLKADGVKLLLEQIPAGTKEGLRDYVMLSLMYTTGIRVSELISIRVKDISLSKPYTLLVHGKGQKNRFVPINAAIVQSIQKYLHAMGYEDPSKLDNWLFINHMRQQFTRQGISYIVQKYSKRAREANPDLIPQDMSPHKIRHSTAMNLVNSGVDLIYIRDLLGHVSVKTTEVYARTDAKLKREAIEAASKELVPRQDAEWENDTGLREWLKDLCKPAP